MACFVYSRTPAFADSDAAGMVHFSRVACYVEEAEHAWLAERGFPIRTADPEAPRWPRVRFEAEYLRPLFPLEPVEVELSAAETGNASITWDWTLRRRGAAEPAARGRMKTVCCLKRGEGLEPCPLPEDLRRGLVSG